MFKVLSENADELHDRGYGAVGAGELHGKRHAKSGEVDYPHATHSFVATRAGKALFEGVTDGRDHAGLNAWASAMHKADAVAFEEIDSKPDKPAKAAERQRHGD